MEKFDKHFEIFLAGVNKIVAEHKAKFKFPFNEVIVARPGRRYIKLVVNRDGRDSSVYCFVDKSNGDCLKSESWSKPAKHARGNIFDASNGLAKAGPYGMAYLK